MMFLARFGDGNLRVKSSIEDRMTKLEQRYLRIGEVAQLSGLSHRALRYYEQIGIVVPQERSSKGYRLYSRKNLEALSHLMLAKSLGFELKEIARQLKDPDLDWNCELDRQEQRILAQIQSCEMLLSRLREQRRQKKKGISDMKKQSNQELFHGLEASALEQEAQARWGDTEVYAESQRRARSYSPADWERYRQEQQVWLEALADCQRRGIRVQDPQVQGLVREHRESCNRWFYPCDASMQKQLVELYESDTRFADYYDRHSPGLSAYLVAAIRAVEQE